MLVTVEIAIITITSYIIGSIPIGYLVCKSKGIDIREVGSGNIGATNVGRALGTKWKIFTLLADASKGAACVLATQYYFNTPNSLELDLFPIFAGMCSILGHNWTIFLQFKGGKGVATGGGVMACLAPYPLLIGLLFYVTVVKITKYVSLGSMVACIVVPISIIALNHKNLYEKKFLIAYSIIMLFLVIYRHKENIKRLLKGEESKIVTKS